VRHLRGLKEKDAIATRSLYNRHDRPQDDCVDEIGTVFALELCPTDRKLLAEGKIVQRHLGDLGLPRDVRETMDAFGEKACLNVPLLFRGEALGILVLVEFDQALLHAGRDRACRGSRSRPRRPSITPACTGSRRNRTGGWSRPRRGRHRCLTRRHTVL
jgi:hypothetical protein